MSVVKGSLTDTDEHVLFSENQVSELVEAKNERWIAEQRLLDEPPKTILINRKQAISKLQGMEQEIIKKHGQATRAWRKAFDVYVKFLKENPGSRAMNSPGNQPLLTSRIETVRSWIRSLDCLDSEGVVLSRSDWRQLFTEGSQAIAEARQQRDTYYAYTSGALATNLSLTGNLNG